MSEAKHTPLPWKVENGAGRGAWIMGADEGWSALVCGNNDETAIANKAFILRACNSHYELLEACRLLIGADGEGMLFSERVNKARLAIAKAEGRA